MTWSRGGVLAAIRAVFVIGCGFGLSGCGGGGTPPAGSSEMRPIATIGEVMDAIVIPSSQALFDAVIYVNGELTRAPKTDDDWFRLRMHAVAVAESSNLLMMPPRARDGGDWMALARAMSDSALVVVRATEAKDIERLLDAGSELYDTCTACHEKYVPQE